MNKHRRSSKPGTTQINHRRFLLTLEKASIPSISSYPKIRVFFFSKKLHQILLTIVVPYREQHPHKTESNHLQHQYFLEISITRSHRDQENVSKKHWSIDRSDHRLGAPTRPRRPRAPRIRERRRRAAPLPPTLAFRSATRTDDLTLRWARSRRSEETEGERSAEPCSEAAAPGAGPWRSASSSSRRRSRRTKWRRGVCS